MEGGQGYALVLKHALDENGEEHLVALLDEERGALRLLRTRLGQTVGELEVPLRIDVLTFLRNLVIVLEGKAR